MTRSSLTGAPAAWALVKTHNSTGAGSQVRELSRAEAAVVGTTSANKDHDSGTSANNDSSTGVNNDQVSGTSHRRQR